MYEKIDEEHCQKCGTETMIPIKWGKTGFYGAGSPWKCTTCNFVFWWRKRHHLYTPANLHPDRKLNL